MDKHKKRKTHNIWISRCMCLIMLLLFLTSDVSQASPGVPLIEKLRTSSSEAVQYEGGTFNKLSYSKIKQFYGQKGYKATQGIRIELDTDDIVASDQGDIPVDSGIGDKKESVLVWEDRYKFFEWSIDIPEEGLYEIAVEYYPLPGAGIDISRELMINGQVPFTEAHNINFQRMWRDESAPKINNIGDEVRPTQEEVFQWRMVDITDKEGMYSEPLLFYFSKGKNSIRMNYINQPLALGKVIVKSPDIIPVYKDMVNEYKSKGYKNAGQGSKFQAESNIVVKSDPTIRLENDGDPATEPRAIGNVKLNVIGGNRWKEGNQWITWRFDVPEDGLYKICMRLGQWWNDGLPSHRQIAIDGKVPFKEMQEYKFKFNENWRGETLQDSSGEPYLFYLTEGEHELTMTVKMGPFREVIEGLEEDSELLSNIILQITMITGDSPDYNYEYDLEIKIPDLLDNLQTLSDRMQDKIDILESVSEKRLAIANNLLMIKRQIDEMIADPSLISRRLGDLNEALGSITTWFESLKNQPIILDYFSILPPEVEFHSKKSNIFGRMHTTWKNFVSSFFKDYDNIAGIDDIEYTNPEIKEHKTIDVWTSMGREWAQVLKELADSDFTPKTGIRINMNVLPSSQLSTGSTSVLMLSIISGKAPDVALGVSSDTPVEFAIRNAIKNLKEFDDFETVNSRFLPGIMIPYHYRGGVYGLPQTISFNVLFYRKDIMSELGLSIPQTWEEVYEDVLPVLYQNRMAFAPGDRNNTYGAFLLQNGGNYYNEDGTRSGLDTPEAYQAFKEWTGLYMNYGMPVAINFFNRMRTGTAPIGVGGFDLYIKLSVAAPELLGKWGVALMPGHRKEDGTIDRSCVGATGQAAIILEQSEHSEEAWEFLKWWTSTETQVNYGREVEALLGPEARWNTANIEAFSSLPWKQEDIDIIREQWTWNKEQPIVVGGYFTGRHLNNAFTRTVMGGVDARDSLEQAVEDINRELIVKQEEYGIGVEKEEMTNE